MKTFICSCGASEDYEPEMALGRQVFARSECAACRRAREIDLAHKEDREARARLEELWRKICPGEAYRQTDPDFPLMDQEVLGAVMRWPEVWRSRNDGRGLALYGETGMRKTRMMFLLLKRLHFEGVRVAAVSAARLAGCFSLCAWRDARGAEAYEVVRRAELAEVLYIDDLGKGRFTAVAQKGLWNLLEERTSRLRPTLWTSNASGRELLEMMFESAGAEAADNAEAILRRLEMCEIIGPLRESMKDEV